MRPNTLAPAPSLQPAQPSIQPQQSAAHHSQQRFYELLDALRMEYDLAAQNSGNGPESGIKMSLNDYEGRGTTVVFCILKIILILIYSSFLVQQQAAELNHMQKTILELEKVFHRMKQE